MQRKLLNFFASKTFLYLIIGLFALQALWIALTGRYPGAFDENFHFGLIQLYAKHWLPFLDAQPPNAEVYGAVARDPSYLYHYLMSFPYRLINLFVYNQPAQIIILRCINVLLVIGGLIIYARILRHSRLSRGLQNMIMLLFATIPVLPLLAGQINYDNLLFVFIGLIVLWTIQLTAFIQRGIFDARLFLKILVASLFACLIKYPFLALFAGIVVYLSLLAWSHRAQLKANGAFDVRTQLSKVLRTWQGASLLVGLVIASGLFVQRFGINMISYHTPIPDCAQVITIDECSAYAPWQRDHIFKQTNTAWKREHIGVYANMWIHQMVREMYFSVYGAFFPNTTVVDYKVAEPLPFMIILGWTLLISGLLAVLICLPRLWRDPILRLFTLMVVIYVGILFVQNYKMYVETAVPVAIHGRYLLPVVPFLGVLYFRAYALLFKDTRKHLHALSAHKNTAILAAWIVVLFICLQGGGILTHIVRSNSDWYWQESSLAQNANDRARAVLRPVIVENKL